MLISETRPLPKGSLPRSKTGIITSNDFCSCVSISDGGYCPNESPGLIAIVIIILSTETRPLSKCSETCRKAGIITSDDFSWCVPCTDGSLQWHWVQTPSRTPYSSIHSTNCFQQLSCRTELSQSRN